MTSIVHYADEYENEWSKYVGNSPNSTIAHQIGWLKVIQRGLGHKPRYLLATEGTTVRGILPLFLVRTWWRTRYLVSLPWIDYGGICAESTEIALSLVERAQRMAREENAKFVELRSMEAIIPDLPGRENKATFLLNLNEDPDILWKSFSAKLRNQIRKSQKSELTTEYGGMEKLADFYKVFSWKMRDLGTPVWGCALFEAILDIFESARIILVKKGESVVAGGLVLAFKDTLYVPSAASYREALKYCPNHALYWNLIKYGCEHGYKCFDFGRSNRDSNTFKFKKQWVPTPTQLTWQYYLNGSKELPNLSPANKKFQLLIKVWSRLPLPVANFLGPKIIKNFP